MRKFHIKVILNLFQDLKEMSYAKSRLLALEPLPITVILNLFQDLKEMSYAKPRLLALEPLPITVILNLFQDLKEMSYAKPIDYIESITSEILTSVRMTQ